MRANDAVQAVAKSSSPEDVVRFDSRGLLTAVTLAAGMFGVVLGTLPQG